MSELGSLPAEPARSEGCGDGATIAEMVLQVAAAEQRRRDAAMSELGLTPLAVVVLRTLHPTDPVEVRHLIALLHWQPPRVSVEVGHLERAGLVSRHTNPADRRKRAVVLTPAGRAVREKLGEIASGTTMVAGLSGPDRTLLAGLLARMISTGAPRGVSDAPEGRSRPHPHHDALG